MAAVIVLDDGTTIVPYNSSRTGPQMDRAMDGGDSVGNLNNLTTTEKSSVVGAINEINGKLSDVGIFPYAYSKGNLSVSKTWNNINNNFQHFVLKVKAGDVVTAMFSRALQAGCLKSYNTPVLNETIDYSEAEGFTDRFVFSSVERTIVIPDDCNYLVLENVYEGQTITINKLLINGYDYAKSLRENVQEIKSVLEQHSSWIGTNSSVIQANTNNIQKNVRDISILSEEISYINLTPLSKIKRNVGFAMSTKKWGQFSPASVYTHAIIPIKPGQNIIAKAQGSAVNIGFLTSYTVPSEGDDVNYSTYSGFNDRIEVRTTEVNLISPADANYLFITIEYASAIRPMSKLIIDGFDYTKAFGTDMIKQVISEDIAAETSENVVPYFSQAGRTYNVSWELGTFSQRVGEKSQDTYNSIRQRTGMLNFKIPVTISCDSQYGFNVVLYDKDEYMTGYASGQGYLNQPVEISANQNFRILMANADTTTDISGINAADYVFIKFDKLSKILYEQPEVLAKWCALGDSITQGYISRVGDPPYALSVPDSWVYKLSKLKKWNVTNHAIGGTGFVRNHPDYEDAAWNVVQDIDFSEFDFVTIAYGVNDWKYNCTLGTFDDEYDTPTTMFGAMRKTIETIIASNPLCKIFMISPINCSVGGNEAGNWGISHAYSNNGTLEQIFQAEKQVAEYYGIEFIDMLHSSIVNRKNIHNCLLDNVHPTAGTHTVMAHEIGGRINWA